ncbi:hypothetical protein A7K94_0202950, partial [Modestobacter sp. VKM Ac-2676]
AGVAARLRDLLAAARPGWPGRALYALASLPLGVLYLALYLGLIGSVVAVVYGVGVLLILLVLAVTRGLAGMERRLARRLLGVDVPDGERVRDQPGVVGKLRRLVLAADTWRALGWLGARLLFALATTAVLLLGAALFVALGWDPEWNPFNALPLLALMVADVVLTLVGVDLLVRLSASVAPRLLGTAPEQRIAALQQRTRRLADRNKLARDLHDTIGHALTASLLQATAARRTLTPAEGRPLQPDFARQALGHIETNTRTALAELDRVLTVLRAEDAGRDPVPYAAPSLDDLEDLLAGLRDGGLPVALVVDGDVDDVPADLQELAYRVVQEGTTNVLRHAGTPLTVARCSATRAPWSSGSATRGPPRSTAARAPAVAVGWPASGSGRSPPAGRSTPSTRPRAGSTCASPCRCRAPRDHRAAAARRRRRARPLRAAGHPGERAGPDRGG